MKLPLSQLSPPQTPIGIANLFALAIEIDPEPLVEVPEEKAGDQIGPYQLLEKLGEGGFGIVWKAEQSRPIRRQVAVKILRPGMDSRSVLQRFRAEQRALEKMEHPNIAAVLDAGMTAPGRPYFVLELVRGRPITTYCEETALPLRERLLLFLDVCQAVQHAHQRAVLHRDLKPSNILIAEAEKPPVPKVIDFGIAKALTHDDADGMETLPPTLHGILLGTPQYMAPEQAALGAQITDVRVDVYALGAILFELLTGTPPLEIGKGSTTSLSVVLDRIHEEEAPMPSARARARQQAGKTAPCVPAHLHGDLDWIVLKALEKSPDRRYESVNALMDDLQRHLADEPVSAGPPGRWYRFKKLVRRNRLTFAITTVISVNLVLLAVVSTFGFLREAEARANAEASRRHAETNAAHAAAESKKATALAEFLTRLLQQAGAFVEQGKNPEALRLAVDQSIASVETLADQPELQAELLGKLGAIYKAMGDSNRALTLFQEQFNVLTQMFGDGDPRTLESLLRLAGVTSEAGDKKKSLELYENLKQRWLSRGASAQVARKGALESYARELSRQGQGAKALEIVKLTESLSSKDSLSVPGLRFQAEIQTGLGLHAEAEASLRQAMERLKKEPGELQTRAQLLQMLSRSELQQGKLPAATAHLEESMRDEEAQRGDQHFKLVARKIEVARLYVKMGKADAAIRSTDEAVAITRRTGSDEQLPRALRAAGEIREQLGQPEAALAFRRECMAVERKNNTDRGKWLYELSEIVRLQSLLNLHDDALQGCLDLWKGIEAEPRAREDTAFIRSLCAIMVQAGERWQQATGNPVHAAAIRRWRDITEGAPTSP